MGSFHRPFVVRMAISAPDEEDPGQSLNVFAAPFAPPPRVSAATSVNLNGASSLVSLTSNPILQFGPEDFSKGAPVDLLEFLEAVEIALIHRCPHVVKELYRLDNSIVSGLASYITSVAHASSVTQCTRAQQSLLSKAPSEYAFTFRYHYDDCDRLQVEILKVSLCTEEDFFPSEHYLESDFSNDHRVRLGGPRWRLFSVISTETVGLPYLYDRHSQEVEPGTSISPDAPMKCFASQLDPCNINEFMGRAAANAYYDTLALLSHACIFNSINSHHTICINKTTFDELVVLNFGPGVSGIRCVNIKHRYTAQNTLIAQYVNCDHSHWDAQADFDEYIHQVKGDPGWVYTTLLCNTSKPPLYLWSDILHMERLVTHFPTDAPRGPFSLSDYPVPRETIAALQSVVISSESDSAIRHAFPQKVFCSLFRQHPGVNRRLAEYEMGNYELLYAVQVSANRRVQIKFYGISHISNRVMSSDPSLSATIREINSCTAPAKPWQLVRASSQLSRLDRVLDTCLASAQRVSTLQRIPTHLLLEFAQREASFAVSPQTDVYLHYVVIRHTAVYGSNPHVRLTITGSPERTDALTMGLVRYIETSGATSSNSSLETWHTYLLSDDTNHSTAFNDVRVWGQSTRFMNAQFPSICNQSHFNEYLMQQAQILINMRFAQRPESTLHYECALSRKQATRFASLLGGDPFVATPNPAVMKECYFHFIHPQQHNVQDTKGTSVLIEVIFQGTFHHAYKVSPHYPWQWFPSENSFRQPVDTQSAASSEGRTSTFYNTHSQLHPLLVDNPADAVRLPKAVTLHKTDILLVLAYGARHLPDYLTYMDCYASHWFVVLHRIYRINGLATVRSSLHGIGCRNDLVDPLPHRPPVPACTPAEVTLGATDEAWLTLVSAARTEPVRQVQVLPIGMDTYLELPPMSGGRPSRPTRVPAVSPQPVTSRRAASRRHPASNPSSAHTADRNATRTQQRSGRNTPPAALYALRSEVTSDGEPSNAADDGNATLADTTNEPLSATQDTVRTATLENHGNNRAAVNYVVRQLNLAAFMDDVGHLSEEQLQTQATFIDAADRILQQLRANPTRWLTYAHPRFSQILLCTLIFDGTMSVLYRISAQFDSMANISLIHPANVAALGLESKVITSNKYLAGAAGNRVRVGGELPPGTLHVLCLPRPVTGALTAEDVASPGMLTVPLRWIVMPEDHLLNAPLLGTDFLQLAQGTLTYKPCSDDGTPVPPSFKYTDFKDEKHEVQLTYLAPTEAWRQGDQ